VGTGTEKGRSWVGSMCDAKRLGQLGKREHLLAALGPGRTRPQLMADGAPVRSPGKELLFCRLT